MTNQDNHKARILSADEADQFKLSLDHMLDVSRALAQGYVTIPRENKEASLASVMAALTKDIVLSMRTLNLSEDEAGFVVETVITSFVTDIGILREQQVAMTESLIARENGGLQ